MHLPGQSTWMFIVIRVRTRACLQETKGACAARLHLLKVRRGHLRWSSPAAAPVFWQVFLGGADAFSPLFCGTVFFLPLYFGGEKNCSSKYIKKISKGPFLAVVFQILPLLKRCSREGFKRSGMFFCLHQVFCSQSSSKVNLGQNKLPFPCLTVLKISW